MAESMTEDPAGYWRGEAGTRWVRHAAFLDAMLADLGRSTVERAAPAPREVVIDVGCGTGTMAFELAERVGPKGRVVGIDVSRAILDAARARPESDSVELVEADAGTDDLAAYGPADLVVSRLGVMFFPDPVGAFRNIRRALRPEGRLVFSSWQEPMKNAWIMEPMLAASALVELPEPPPEGAPGPFSLANPDRVRSVLEEAGFRDVRFEALEGPIRFGHGMTSRETARFFLEMGPVARLTDDIAPDVAEAVAEAIASALAARRSGDAFELESAAWLVSARAGGA